MKTYEALIIFSNRLKEEELDGAMSRVRADIERTGGQVLNVRVVGKRTFARPLQKQESGIYVWVAFDSEEASVATLRHRFKLNEDIFRVQILTTDETSMAKYSTAAASETGTDGAVVPVSA